jgi:hypothetical protein
MELLISIVLLLFVISFCMRFILGERVYEHVKAMFVYDTVKGFIKLPFQLIKLVLKALKII